MSYEFLTVRDVLDILGIARSTFDTWLHTNRGPRHTKMPNGAIRIRRADLEEWIDGLTRDGVA